MLNALLRAMNPSTKPQKTVPTFIFPHVNTIRSGHSLSLLNSSALLTHYSITYRTRGFHTFPTSVRVIFLQNYFFGKSTSSYFRSSINSQRLLKSLHSSKSHQKAYFSSSKSTSPSSPTMNFVKVKHIVVKSKDYAESIKDQIQQNNKAFDDLVKESICTSKRNNGKLGWIPKGSLDPMFEDACFQATLNEATVVESRMGWHVFIVEEKKMVEGKGDISVFELADSINSEEWRNNVQLIDCRERFELDLAKLPGFLNLPMQEYGSWKDDIESGKILNFDKETIVMCHHGRRSANFCAYLKSKGFTNVRNLVGGIDLYAKQIDSSVGLY